MNPTKKYDASHIFQWEYGWDGHERMQLERLADLPFAEKLEWLEKSHRLVMQIGAAQRHPSISEQLQASIKKPKQF